MSWKTTLCGVLVLLGGVISQFFPEIARWGLALASFGGGLGLLFARDNNKSSEQVGAGQFDPPAAGRPAVRLLLALLLLAVPIMATTVTVGCKSPPQRIPFNTVNAPAVTVAAALSAWDDYVGSHSVPVADQVRVKVAYERYQSGMLLAIDAAHAYADSMSMTNGVAAGLKAQLTSQNAANALADLLGLLRKFGLNV